MLDRDLWTDAQHGLQGIGDLTYADFSRDGSIEAMSGRLLDDAPERFVLIGFSMGGYVAREAARRAPRRVLALVLIATSSREDSDIQAQRMAAVARAPNLSKFTGLSRRSIASSLAADHADEATIARIRAMGDRLGGEVFQRQSNLVRYSDTECLADISCPTLVIAAAEDRLRSLAEAQELQEGIRQSTLITIAGSGHMIPMEAPESMVDAIAAWLGSLPGASP
ncbi:MAG: alpha/beta hydrolase [Alphaproteobacteria bacterium]|nr:alpha/beta hydrolase [Alphaproteobacteria bacterium]MBU4041172.1 alpha/beta hydrolase [Alphaproteobacteria bacterium]MBU4136018.1 alpha/beta hydrolase [Alphaproteobacteria bacterium]